MSQISFESSISTYPQELLLEPQIGKEESRMGELFADTAVDKAVTKTSHAVQPIVIKPSKGSSNLERFQKLDADGINKVIKFARAALMTVGEALAGAGIFQVVPQFTGVAPYSAKTLPYEFMKGHNGKTIADKLNSSRKILECFIDVFGSKGLGRLVLPGKDGFIQSVSNPKPLPFAEPKTFHEKIKNTEASFNPLRQFYQSAGAAHNVLKLPTVSFGIAQALASLPNTMLKTSAETIKYYASSFVLLDTLLLDLPAHIASVSFHMIVVFEAAKEGFKEGFNQEGNSGLLDATSAAFKQMVNRLGDEHIMNDHLLVGVRFAAQTGLMIGLNLATAGIGSPLLLAAVAPFKNYAISGTTGLILLATESTIGAYRAWNKTAPKEQKPAQEEVAVATKPIELENLQPIRA